MTRLGPGRVDYATGWDLQRRVHEQVARYLQALEDVPKSRGWKFRARVGESKRWYELPEEVR